MKHGLRPCTARTYARQAGHIVAREPWVEHMSPKFSMHHSSLPFIPTKYTRTPLESWAYLVRNYMQLRAGRQSWHSSGAKRRRLKKAHAMDRVKDKLQLRVERVAGGFQEWAAVGCSALELRAHLEKQFVRGMTWHNHGGVWFIDHILPRLTFRDEARAFRVDNLRPALGCYEQPIYRAAPT